MEQRLLEEIIDSDLSVEFIENIRELVPKLEFASSETIISVFWNQLFKDWKVEATLEFKRSKNWIRAFSLIFWTEKNEGAEDYTEWELKFMELVVKVLKPKYRDFSAHENAKLMLPAGMKGKDLKINGN